MSRARSLRASEEVRGAIRALHPERRRKVWVAIDLLRSEPFQGRALRDELGAYWRFPVGQLRIVYRFSARELEVAAIGERAAIYEDRARRLRR